MDEALIPSADVFKYWHIDFERGMIRIVLQDGRVVDDTLDPRYRRAGSLVATSTFDWEKWWILSTTTRNDLIFTEGYNPTAPPPLNGRPSVYLDQNRWSTIADAVHDPTRIEDPDERRAALELIQLASDGGIVLPLSTGHLIETAGLNGDRRYEVGVVMAHLAAGWQIRNPLDLWRHECEASIRKHLGMAGSIPILYPIVTEPDAILR